MDKLFGKGGLAATAVSVPPEEEKKSTRFTATEILPSKFLNTTQLSASAAPSGNNLNVTKKGFSQRSGGLNTTQGGGSDEDDLGGDDDEDGDEEDDVDIKSGELIFHPESMLRQWLKKRGKQHCIDFDDEELRQLRSYFNSLDEDGSGAIGVDELEDPLK